MRKTLLVGKRRPLQMHVQMSWISTRHSEAREQRPIRRLGRRRGGGLDDEAMDKRCRSKGGGNMKTYFTDDELRCKCCGKVDMDKNFMRRLNHARDQAMVLFSVTSGYRCEKHNTDVGSTSTNHTSGKAVDLSCNTAGRRYMMIKELILAGIKGIGIGPTYIHADTNRELGVIWLYEP